MEKDLKKDYSNNFKKDWDNTNSYDDCDKCKTNYSSDKSILNELKEEFENNNTYTKCCDDSSEHSYCGITTDGRYGVYCDVAEGESTDGFLTVKVADITVPTYSSEDSTATYTFDANVSGPCEDCSDDHKEKCETVINTLTKTDEQFADAINSCRDIFTKKLVDYGASWRIMRPSSITDQIYIKANRIRSIEESGVSLVGEGILPEFQAIVNYGIVGLIQLELGYSNTGYDLSTEDAIALYDKYAQVAFDLMLKKNHDYNEAWRLMRTYSYTDFILTKTIRTRQIEDNRGKTLVSEGVDANYLDMINYAVFGIIKLSCNSDIQ